MTYSDPDGPKRSIVSAAKTSTPLWMAVPDGSESARTRPMRVPLPPRSRPSMRTSLPERMEICAAPSLLESEVGQPRGENRAARSGQDVAVDADHVPGGDRNAAAGRVGGAGVDRGAGGESDAAADVGGDRAAGRAAGALRRRRDDRGAVQREVAADGQRDRRNGAGD